MLEGYKTLGRSGLIVSPLALGTMTFGQEQWGASEDEAEAVLQSYVDAGGNFIDTADVYAGGRSEEHIGAYVAKARLRDRIVLATKYGFNASASPLSLEAAVTGNPNAGGTGAKNIHRALDASLRRLQTDYVDLYWMHIWDGVTPVAEIVGVLGDLVRRGKIRYFGLSDMPAWVAIKASTIARERGIPRPIAMQVEYSLVARDVEAEHVPAASEEDMGIVAWSPLAGGFLTGKYRRDDFERRGRLSGANPFGNSKFSERNWAILDVLKTIATERETSPERVALAWTMQRPATTAVLIGARTPEQLRSNLDAATIRLTTSEIDRLDTVGAPAATFSSSLTSAPIRRMIFGGNVVKDWREQSLR